MFDAPDRTTWSGQRDAALFAFLYNTGVRVSEIIRLRVADVLVDRAHAVHLHGKGRKQRVILLRKSTVAQLHLVRPYRADLAMKEAAVIGRRIREGQPLRVGQ